MSHIKEKISTQIRFDKEVRDKVRKLSYNSGLSMNFIINDIMKKHIDNYIESNKLGSIQHE